MGRVVALLAAAGWLSACAPRPAALYLEAEASSDWLLLTAETRRVLIHRQGERLLAARPNALLPLGAGHLLLEASDGRGTLERFDEEALRRLESLFVGPVDVHGGAEVIGRGERTRARERCCVPQVAFRTMLVPGAACPLPAPSAALGFDAADGTVWELEPEELASGGALLLDPEPARGRTCRSFAGTERVLAPTEPDLTEWAAVEGLGGPVAPEDVVLAGGRTGFAVLTSSSAHFVSRWGRAEAFEALPEGTAQFVAGGYDPRRGRGHLAVGLRGSDATSGVVARYEESDEGPPELAATTRVPPNAGWPTKGRALVLLARAEALLILEDGGRLGILPLASYGGADVPRVERLEARDADGGAAVARGAAALASEVFSTQTSSSTWFAWQDEDGLRLAWVPRWVGALEVTVYRPARVPPATLAGLVALDEDRVVLVLRSPTGELALWEWLQLPARADHPYDQACDRAQGSFCLRPFPTSTLLDGRVACAGPTPVVHAWVRPDHDLHLLLADGRTWSLGAGCRESGLPSALRAVSVLDGRTLVLDRAGGLWVSR